MIRSSVSSKDTRASLFKGSLIALSGVAIIFFMGICFPLDTLRTWGFPLFILSLTLITMGLLPYRQLTQLQNQPNSLSFSKSNDLQLSFQDQVAMLIPLSLIKEMSYEEFSANKKGILVEVDEKNRKRIQFYQKKRDLSRREVFIGFPTKNKIFFGRFSKRSAEEMIEEFRDRSEQDHAGE